MKGLIGALSNLTEEDFIKVCDMYRNPPPKVDFKLGVETFNKWIVAEKESKRDTD